MSKLKVHRLTISENSGNIVLVCGIRYPNAGTTWMPKIVTCKNCKRISKQRKLK